MVSGLAFVSASPTYATSTALNVVIRDASPARVEITRTPSGARVNTPHFNLSVRVHNVSQLIVYVDGHYASSTAVPPGTANYSVPVTLVSGRHIVKIIGLDPFTNTQDTASVVIVYNPSLPPTIPQPLKQGASGNESSPSGVVVKPPQKKISDTTEPLGLLDQVGRDGYHFLRQIDIVGHEDSHGSWAMLCRFTLVLIGLILLLAPREVLLFGAKLRIVSGPAITRTRPRLYTRALGVILLIIPFIWL